jgi:hypothetical protein
MIILGFRNAFCKHNGITTQVHFENFLNTLKNSVINQENDISFAQNHMALLEYLNYNFKQDFGLKDLKRVIRNSEPMAGLIENKLLAPNTIFEGDIKKFAELAFSIVRPVKYLF